MCDTLVSLTDDGILFAKNSDRDPNEAQLIEWHPAVVQPQGGSVRATWIEIDAAARTRSILISRPWWMWGAEMGANDAGVVIGNEAVFTRRHEDGPGLLGMDLLRLALERAGNRDDAVQVIVSLLERHGQGGSCSFEHPSFSYDNSFLIADPAGAIVLETAGRRWATEAVTGRSRAISNGLTIGGFAKSHADPFRTAVSSSRARRAITEPAAGLAEGPAELFSALRSHGNRPEPTYHLKNGAMSAPCMHAGGLLANSQTVGSWVSDLRGVGDDPAAATHWVTGTAAPCTSLFKPVRVDVPVQMGHQATNRDDRESRWWRHERLHRAVMTDPLGLLARYSHERDRVESSWLDASSSGTAAFDRADELTDRWTRDVVDGLGADHRPARVRRYWDGQDRRAGLAWTAPVSV